MIPIADFLTGSLLTLLLPVALLIALVVWYLMFLRRVPEPADGKEADRAPAAPNPGPGDPPEASQTRGEG
jgi:hypothetical protein